MVRLLPGNELVEPTHVTIDIEESSRFWLYTLSRHLRPDDIEEILEEYEWFLAATLLLNEQRQCESQRYGERVPVEDSPQFAYELTGREDQADS